MWFLGGASHWTGNERTGDAEFSIPSSGGFGRMGASWAGPSFSYSEGINTVRSVFTAGGMTLVFSGHFGTDASALTPCGACKSRRATCSPRPTVGRFGSKASGSPKVLEGDELLGDEEPVIIGMIDGTVLVRPHGL